MTSQRITYVLPEAIDEVFSTYLLTPRAQEAQAMPTPTIADIATDRDATIQHIRTTLRRRSGKTWSVTGGKGTAYGWITVQAPPARRDRYGSMSPEDMAELSALLGTTVHHQGQLIPASREYRREYLERAEGRTPTALATPYWD